MLGRHFWGSAVRIVVDLVEVRLSSDLYRTLVKVCMTGRNRGVEMKIDE